MINNFINISNELIVYCIDIFVLFFSFLFFSFWGFSVYRMQICFDFKNLFFFFFPNLGFQPVFTETSWNTRNRLKWPEIFSKWNRNTLDKIPRVATTPSPKILESTILLNRSLWTGAFPFSIIDQNFIPRPVLSNNEKKMIKWDALSLICQATVWFS